MNIGDRIKAARLERGWTQLQLAERVGCTRPLVTMWEGGKVESMLGKYLMALATALGRSAEWVWTGKEARSQAGETSQPARLRTQTLTHSIALVEDRVKLSRKHVPATKKARLVSAIYTALTNHEPGAERIVKELLDSLMAVEGA